MTELPIRCHCRRHAVTSLRCARCSVPICPDCSVIAPAGMLCRECASPGGFSLFQVSAGSVVLALPVCLIVSALAGWLLVGLGLGFGFFGLLLAFVYGVFVAEVAIRSTGRKRGSRVELLAGFSAAAGILIGALLPALWHGYPAGAVLHMLVSSLFFWLDLVIGVVSAVNRVRYL